MTEHPTTRPTALSFGSRAVESGATATPTWHSRRVGAVAARQSTLAFRAGAPLGLWRPRTASRVAQRKPQAHGRPEQQARQP